MSGAWARRAAIVVAAVALAACGEPPPEPPPEPAQVPPAPVAVAPEPPAPSDLVFDGVPLVARGARWKVAKWAPDPAADSPGEGGANRTVLRAIEVSPENGRPPLHVVVRMTPQFQAEEHQRRPYTQDFRSWGKTVRVSNTRELALAHYEDWIRESADVLKDLCRIPGGGSNGAKLIYGGRAVATDRTTRKREYRTWFVWSRNAAVPETYVATFLADVRSDVYATARDAAALDLIESIQGTPQSAPK